MLNIIPAPDLEGLNVYPAYLDPFSQMIAKPDISALRRRLYLDAIINEHIIPSISHIIGSNATTKLLLDEPGLLEEKIITPFISQPYCSPEGYIEGHLNSFDIYEKIYNRFDMHLNKEIYKRKLFTAYPANDPIDKTPIDELINLKKDLLAHTKLATTYSSLAAKDVLKDSIIRDFDQRMSPFTHELSRCPEFNNDLEPLLSNFLFHENRINRAFILKLIEKSNIKGADHDLFLSILNSNYYLAGISQLNCPLGSNLDQEFINVCRRKFECHNAGMKQSVIKGEIKNRVFDKFLDIMNIKPHSLDGLDLDGLIEIRNDSATRSFRKQYNLIIDQKIKGYSSQDNIFNIKDMEMEVIEAIKGETRRQFIKRNKIKKIKDGLWGISAIAFGSFIANYIDPGLNIPIAFDFASGVAGFMGDPILNIYEQKKCNFIILSEKVRTSGIAK